VAAKKRDPRSALARDTLQSARNFLADERARRLPPAQRYFLLAGMLTHANADLALWPRIALWAAEAGVSERTAKEALASVRTLDLLESPLLTVKKVRGKRTYQFDPALATAHLDTEEADSAPAKGKTRTDEVQDLPPDGADRAPVPNGLKERSQENEEQERSSVEKDTDEDLAFALSHFKPRGQLRDAVLLAYRNHRAGLANAMVMAAKKDNPGAYLAVLIREGVHEEPATTSFAEVRRAIKGGDPIDDLPTCEVCGFRPYVSGVLREVSVRRKGEPIVTTVCENCERHLQ
jgi:hypothetical protein